jgi:hypothetical protein
MPIAGVIHTQLAIGAINTDASATIDHNFAKSSVWGYSVLQKVDVNSDTGGAATYVLEVDDGSGTKTGLAWTGVFSPNCTRIS